MPPVAAAAAYMPCEDCPPTDAMVVAGADQQFRSMNGYKNGRDVGEIVTVPPHSHTGVYQSYELIETYNVRDETDTITGTCTITTNVRYVGGPIIPDQPEDPIVNTTDGCQNGHAELKESQLNPAGDEIDDDQLETWLKEEVIKLDWEAFSGGAHLPGAGLFATAGASDGSAAAARVTDFRYRITAAFEDLAESGTVQCTGGEEGAPRLNIAYTLETDVPVPRSAQVTFRAAEQRFSEEDWTNLPIRREELLSIEVADQRFNLRHICFIS